MLPIESPHSSSLTCICPKKITINATLSFTLFRDIQQCIHEYIR
uniref:Uncharacterized protein n=1 Tax=Rhizophora mucronata TaxID=61149 RepID=A0A2P2N8E1_RHIMU